MMCRVHGWQNEDACKPCNRARALVWYWRHREPAKAAAIERRRALRREVLAAYGGACECCGEATPEFLSVDHVHGNGGAHRREIGAGQGDTTAVLRWLKRHNFPRDGFRLLCFNCHLARTYWGACPHEAARARATTA